jgi:hypothetical protein
MPPPASTSMFGTPLIRVELCRNNPIELGESGTFTRGAGPGGSVAPVVETVVPEEIGTKRGIGT